jgi:nitrite reductase (NAD(P)H)
MADVLSHNLATLANTTSTESKQFTRPDLSTKLKLIGVDVASFGDFFADRDGPRSVPGQQASKPAIVFENNKSDPDRFSETLTNGRRDVRALTYKDPFGAVYKKYLFTLDGKFLLGGMMIGDTKDYVRMNQMVKTQKELDVPPSRFILGSQSDGEENADDL